MAAAATATAIPGIEPVREIRVPVAGGKYILTIGPWSMEQHDRCFPVVAAVLEEWLSTQSDGATPLSLAQIILRFKDQAVQICRYTVQEELNTLGISWDKDLHGEDLFGICDAIWQTSLFRPGGGGVLGKALALLGPAIFSNLQKGAQALQKKSTPTSSDE